ncbi:dihydroorotase family protein [Streptomyces sp. NPDC004134]|uniref:dihydroorotase n=1 Tax=Streptomyces sp. NPDC004134 TaxID=3364691 RepID=UPI00369BA1F0
MRLLISGGTLITDSATQPADILCENGSIAALTAHGTDHGPVDDVLDATGLLVFPGLIDPHVHSRDPGQTDKETFAASTRAAACSGITTMLEMPNALPPVTDSAVFAERAGQHAEVAACDFGLWALSLGRDNLDDLPGLFAAGAVGVKIFWGYGLDRATKRLVYNTSDLPAEQVIPPPGITEVWEVLARAAAAGALVAAHCEDPGVLAYAGRHTGAITTYQDLLDARPVEAESTAIAQAVEAARRIGGRFHVLHVATARGVELVRRARADGIPVTAETCPHYLFLTQDDAALHTGTKVYPPIRSRHDQDALWQALREGTITSLSSDHAPHAPADKQLPLDTQPAGMHGVETLVPLMLDALTRGRITPQRLAHVLSTSTAELYALPRKGRIHPGYDADFTLVDPEATFTIDQERLHTRHPLSVFHGRRGRGVATATVLRGRPLMKDGELLPGAPRGTLVRSRPPAAVPAPRGHAGPVHPGGPVNEEARS